MARARQEPVRRPRRRGRVTRPQIPGVSKKQLDHWLRLELLQVPFADGRRGTGRRRIWSEEEVRVATDMGRLRRAGVALRQAARVARAGEQAVQEVLARLHDGGEGGGGGEGAGELS